MICPDCGYDNIEGVDGCEQCGQPLVDFDPTSCELEESISRHSIAVLTPKPVVTIQGAPEDYYEDQSDHTSQTYNC